MEEKRRNETWKVNANVQALLYMCVTQFHYSSIYSILNHHHSKSLYKSGLYSLHSQTLNFFFFIQFHNCSNLYIFNAYVIFGRQKKLIRFAKLSFWLAIKSIEAYNLDKIKRRKVKRCKKRLVEKK